jgi:hypothetical protein
MLAIDFGNESPAGPAASGHVCPVCGVAGHVEKVSSLVRRNSGTVVIGGAAYPYFSNLGSSLALPPRPEGRSVAHAVGWALVSAAIAVLGVLVIGLLGDQHLAELDAGYLHDARRVVVYGFAIAIPGFLLLRAGITALNAHRQSPKWVGLYNQWSRLYYCSNDDMIFFRGESRSASPEDMLAFLNDTDSGIAAVPIAVRSEAETAPALA